MATKLSRCRATAPLRADEVDVERRWPKPPSFEVIDSVGAEFPRVEFRTRTRFEISLPLPEYRRECECCGL